MQYLYYAMLNRLYSTAPSNLLTPANANNIRRIKEKGIYRIDIFHRLMRYKFSIEGYYFFVEISCRKLNVNEDKNHTTEMNS